jgi:hypothetical protein
MGSSLALLLSLALFPIAVVARALALSGVARRQASVASAAVLLGWAVVGYAAIGFLWSVAIAMTAATPFFSVPDLPGARLSSLINRPAQLASTTAITVAFGSLGWASRGGQDWRQLWASRGLLAVAILYMLNLVPTGTPVSQRWPWFVWPGIAVRVGTWCVLALWLRSAGSHTSLSEQGQPKGLHPRH